MEKNYDIIVIGSGIGGLASASLLTKIFKKKVLVIERHGKLGGLTHTFKRLDKYKWDVGLHYVGALEKSGPTEKLFSYITGGKLNWIKMPHHFEKFIYPNFDFTVPSDPEEYKKKLLLHFSKESAAIHKYFKDIRNLTKAFGLRAASIHFPSLIQKILTYLAKRMIKKTFQSSFQKNLYSITTDEYLSSLTNNTLLKSVLCSQWMDYGLPPEKSSIFTHAAIVSHYLNGAYYPEGGSNQIAELIKLDLESKGCTFLVSHDVQEILIESNKAIGVRCKDRKATDPSLSEKIYKSDIVISNAGAKNTYLKLLPLFAKIPFRREIENTANGCTNISLFLGLKESPSKLGLNGENLWIFSNPNHNEIDKNKNGILNGYLEMCYVSFPSLKEKKESHHTIEVLVPVDYEPFFRWKDQPVKNRDDEYKRLKTLMTSTILDFLEQRLPGLKELVDYTELGTPITNEYYENTYRGEIYGVPATPDRIKAEWISPKTPIANLYLAGADATVHGIVGALWSSISCALAIYGWKSFGKISEALARSKN